MKKIWLRSYPKDVPASIYVPIHSGIPEFFDDTVRTYPHRPSLIYFGRKIHYAKLDNLVNRCTGVISSLGIKPGDRVALHLPNIPQFVIIYLAILKYGAVAVPINPTYAGKDLEHILRESGARGVITITKFLPAVLDVKNNSGIEFVLVTNVKDYLPWMKKVLFTLFKEWREGHRIKGIVPSYVFDFSKKMAQASPLTLPRTSRKTLGSIALLQYTGGTTGRPKGVILTHRNIAANAMQVRSWLPDFENGREVIAAVLPFFHIYALSAILNVGVLSGATIVLFPEPNLDNLLSGIKSHGITVLPGVPLLYERILKHPKAKNTKSLKMSVSGAAPLKEKTQREFEALSDSALVEGYGLTETSGATHVNPIGGGKKNGSIGLPIPSTNAKIVDPETCKERSRGELGELAVQGPQIMSGYWGDESSTQTVLKNGWFLTGDIAYYDQDGFFFIVDRKKDMIQLKGSGLKVYPSEVEEVIIQIDFIQDVAVAGRKDAEGDETPVAFVVLKEGVEPSNERKKEIKAYCIKHLAPYKIPREIEFVAEIPKTIIGKPLRRKLRDE